MNLSSLVSIFVQQLVIGMFFGMVWAIPKWGNRIFAGFIAVFAILSIFTPSFSLELYTDYWYVNGMNILGTVAGLMFGRLLMDDIVMDTR